MSTLYDDINFYADNCKISGDDEKVLGNILEVIPFELLDGIVSLIHSSNV